MKNYIKQWTLIRLLRLIIGIVVIVQGIMINEWLVVGTGAVFSLLPLFNMNLCDVGACGLSPQAQNRSNTKMDDVTYEEVK